MFELTLESNYAHEQYFEDAKSTLSQLICEMGGVVVSGISNGRVYLSLAIKKEFKHIAKTHALETAANLIVSIFKGDFLDSVMAQGYLTADVRSSLVAALAAFDKDTDVDIAKKHIIFDNNLLIDSTYFFKMSELRERWSEIAELVSNNLPNLIAGDSVFEMMRFLIKTTPSKTPEVYLSDLGDKIAILKDNKISEHGLIFEKNNKTLEKDMIGALISLAPQKIFLTHKLHALLPFIDKMENLFEGKIYTT